MRKKTKQIKIGNVPIGGGAPITIQSMTNTKTDNIAETIAQIHSLAEAGCEIVRVAVPNFAAAKAIYEIKKQIKIPLVADIHFDYRLAIECANAGADKIRINPGNIGSSENTKAVVTECRNKKIPIRIGINSGSLERDIHEQYGISAEGMAESAKRHIKILEALDFTDICVSLKASDVQMTIAANMLFSEHFNYPLHIGVTESGIEYIGTIKSAIGIGGLLALGIGDTIRVSISADPVREIPAAKAILKALCIGGPGINIVSCPTCGRCSFNVIAIADELEKRVENIKKSLKVAVMGCAVNGPGEARDADFGVAGGNGEGILFKKGEIIGKTSEQNAVNALVDLITEAT